MTDPVIQFEDRPGLLDLGWGHPRPALLPVREWRRASAEALLAYGEKALTYGRERGPGPLVDWLCTRLADTGPEQTFVTAGASHALDLTCAALTRPGDVVLVDSPTYHLAFRVLTDRGLRLAAVPADDPAAVARRLAELRAAGRRVPLFYLVPTFGNPTGRSLPPDRRRELLALAAAHDLTLVEDDTYRELSYDGPAPASLWSRGPGVVRLGSFAKTVAPGLRLGWINAAPPVVEQLTRLGYVHSGGGVNHATALAMAVFGQSGAYAAHVSAVRERYREQRDALAGALGTPAPAGGWFIWLPLPAGVHAERLLPVAEAYGTSFVPGTRFYADAPGDGAGFVRLSFSHLGVEDLVEAANRLTRAVEHSSGRTT